MSKKFCLLFTIIWLSSIYSPLLKAQNPIIIVIDAGHGGNDPGKPRGHQTMKHEKDLNLDIALRVGYYLEENIKNVKVLYTRDTDKYVGLSERTDFANTQQADFFVSIHCNSNPSPAISGAEVHIHTPQLSSSKKLAALIGESLHKNGGRKFRGIVDARQRNRNLYVTQYTDMPSVLVETGYLSNSTEEKFLNSSEGQDKIAEAVYLGCKQYIQLHVPKENRKNIYKVQIMATHKLLEMDAKIFEELEEKVEVFETNASEKYRYKYLVGREYDAQRAEVLAEKMIKLGFKGAFVVQVE